MATLSIADRIVGAYIGHLIGDAAALGTHWIYSDEGIAKAVAHFKSLAFADPKDSKPFYAIMPSYFAHGAHRAGDLSHYGATARLGASVLLSQKEIGTDAAVRAFKRSLTDTFGFGGSYVGYVDAALRETLMATLEDVPRALETVPKTGVDDETWVAIIKVKTLPLAKRYDGAELVERVVAATKASHDTEAAIALATKAAQVASAALSAPTGTNDDVQMNALVRSVVATLGSEALGDDAALREVHEWTRLTQDNAETHRWIAVAHALLRAVLKGESVDAAIARLDDKQNADVRAALDKARSSVAQDHRDFVGGVGRSCFLRFGIPSLVHILLQVTGDATLRPEQAFERAIEQTLYAGGDSCGRASFVGAVLGARYGVQGIPAKYIARLSDATAIVEEANAIAAFAQSRRK